MMEISNICGDGLCRPGGFSITERALAYCNFKRDARLADIGCGLGATVRYIRQNYGFEIYGVERNREILARASIYCQGEMLYEAYAEKLPFKNNELDGLIFECSLSKMKDPCIVLEEGSRILKPQGYLIISDMYARGEPAQLAGLLGRMDTRETLLEQLETRNFVVDLFEDHSCSLQELLGQIVFEYGAAAMYENLGTDRAGLHRIKCGYCLMIARKREEIA